MPTVSIIIPLYNQSKYVGDAIQSALDQTFKDFKVIVVDDGSTDASPGVVARFGNQVRYIRQENQGLAGARNTGIRAAQGELVGLLDADDQWLPDYLKTMVLLAENNPGAAVFYCCAQSMDETGHDLPQIFGGPARAPETLYTTLLRANFLIPSTILMRRSVVMEAGLFDQSLRSCEDWDLWLRILPRHKFIGTSRCLVRYRLHGQSLSTDPTGMQAATRAVIEKQFGLDYKQPQTWSPEKRLAYGGVYRYFTLTSAQRQGNWETAGSYLRQALQVDPSLSVDLDLFYDLAHGSQPAGYRGNAYQLDLEGNARRIEKMLSDIFAITKVSKLDKLRRRTYGTAYYALGLLAYNTGKRAQSRKFLLSALLHRSELWLDRRVTGDLAKSLVSPSLVNRIKRSKILTHTDRSVPSVRQ